MKECRKFQKKIGLYYYDELTPQEKQALEEHAAKCEECAAEINNIKFLLDTVSTKEIPDQSPEFWADYDTTLKEKLGAEKKLTNRTNNIISGIRQGIKDYLFPDLRRNFHPAFSAIAVILLIGAALFIGYNSKDFETGTVPDKSHQLAQSPVNEEKATQQNIEPVRTAVPETMIAMTDPIKEQEQTPIKKLLAEMPESSQTKSEQTIVIREIDNSLKVISHVTEKEPAELEEKKSQPIILANTPTEDHRIEARSLSSVPEIEDALILQKLALLMELGEDIDLPLNGDEIIKDIAFINDISSS